MSEAVLLAAPVVLKRDGEKEGRVFVTSEARLIFIPGGETAASVVWSLADVQAQRLHPRLPLVQVRLLVDGVTEELTFKFQDVKGAAARETAEAFVVALKSPGQVEEEGKPQVRLG